ncbi:MAG: molybdopterin molybdotransferase MoeA [Oscillospiraceae bacterium]|jgi:molybdopterin molybdotransferase|nr:molybdopterin molybdotransferase MoeA [Oscillospiraceae bacterium]
MQKGVAPQTARDLLLAVPFTLPPVEHVSLTSARGRVLSEDILADVPIPPFDRSPFDGYAFRGEDTADASQNAPVTLKITEELPAGTAPTKPVTPGFAAKILTGAPLPRGANATIKYEETEFTDATVKLVAPVAPRKNVVYAGEDVALGALVARRGDVISPAMLGLFASVGRSEVPVYKKPIAAVLNTGSELVEPGNPLPPAKIYNSSVFVLISALEDIGFEAYNAGVVRDEPTEIAARMRARLDECDVLITTGGASVGDYDFSVAAAQRLGAEILFWKTTLKPGGAMVMSRLGEKLILSLSGNPGSALMGLTHIAKPALRARAGHRDVTYEPVFVKLKHGFENTSGRSRVLRGHLEIGADAQAYFVQEGAQGGGALSSFAFCDLLAELPAKSGTVAAGAVVPAYKM